MDAFQSFVVVLTTFSMLLSAVSLMRSNNATIELSLMQRRIDELETHLSKGFAILDLPRELGKQFSNCSWIPRISVQISMTEYKKQYFYLLSVSKGNELTNASTIILIPSNFIKFSAIILSYRIIKAFSVFIQCTFISISSLQEHHDTDNYFIK